ncbi:PREDICTED: cyclin-dependent protein kinase inhibitor SMR2 [Tarenaya hassleriana]|uniref:cyclin-dependent protein kinase inhibitor SMR2 n=1 Tax=Tarenaya hassleriana TaxID=28532 RepID=UPI00053C18C2|nr:PREDICTED: cyclin-dependent protein kinase inhibitor SMR2 [Tarenaya hassleriana]
MAKDLETLEGQPLQEREQEQEQEQELTQTPTSQEEENHRETSKRSEELGLVTPSSSDHKIPAAETCPPAPRKQRRENLPTRKRRLSEDLRFFEDTDFGRREVESFFVGVRRCQTGLVKRRRCRST